MWSPNYDTGSYVVDSSSTMAYHHAGRDRHNTYASYTDALNEKKMEYNETKNRKENKVKTNNKQIERKLIGRQSERK